MTQVPIPFTTQEHTVNTCTQNQQLFHIFILNHIMKADVFCRMHSTTWLSYINSTTPLEAFQLWRTNTVKLVLFVTLQFLCYTALGIFSWKCYMATHMIIMWAYPNFCTHPGIYVIAKYFKVGIWQKKICDTKLKF